MLLLLLALAAGTLAPSPARAATSCTAGSTALAFGNVTGAGTVDSNATVTVTCITTALQIAATVRVRMCLNIDAGLNGGGQVAPRRMTNATGDTLAFQIYQDSARSLVWGNSANPLVPTPLPLDLSYSYLLLIGSGTGTATATMYGRVPAQAGLAAGAFVNPFTGSQTRLDYRYAEPVVGTPPFPASCLTGGTGGGSVTFPFTASANVPANCSIQAATTLDFGSIPGVITANQDRTSTVTLACTGRTPYNIGLDNGQHASGTTRRMERVPSGGHVAYELYRDPARTQRWGGTIGSDTVTGTGTGGSQQVTVHGRVPAGQVVPPGSFRDVVTVTVTY